MGTGREIGSRLRTWMATGRSEPLSGRLLEGVLLDALDGETRLRGAVRDLAFQPLVAKLLQEPSPAVRRSLLDTLTQELGAIYAPAVLAELLDLLEAAADLPPGRRPQPSMVPPLAPSPREVLNRRLPQASTVPPAVPSPPIESPSPPLSATAKTSLSQALPPLPRLMRRLGHQLHPLAPGMALAFANGLVLRWLGSELDPLRPAAWSSTLLLLVALLAFQLLLLRPLARLRRVAPLRLADSGDPRRAWCWITAPWVHHRQGEALLNGTLLLILLGNTPLPLGPLLLRYQLSSLASLIPAVLLARHWRLERIWDGASGAVAALIGLAAGVSLLQWQAATFPFGVLTVPIWVLFLVNGAIQMAWVLPSAPEQRGSPPWQRLLSSCWFWGTVLGLLWAGFSRLLEWAGPLWQNAITP